MRSGHQIQIAVVIDVDERSCSRILDGRQRRTRVAEIVSEFKTHFVDTKLFWDTYAHGKFAQYFFKAYEEPTKNPSKEAAHMLVEEAQLFVDAAYQCYTKTGNLAGTAS